MARTVFGYQLITVALIGLSSAHAWFAYLSAALWRETVFGSQLITVTLIGLSSAHAGFAYLSAALWRETVFDSQLITVTPIADSYRLMTDIGCFNTISLFTLQVAQQLCSQWLSTFVRLQLL